MTKWFYVLGGAVGALAVAAALVVLVPSVRAQTMPGGGWGPAAMQGWSDEQMAAFRSQMMAQHGDMGAHHGDMMAQHGQMGAHHAAMGAGHGHGHMGGNHAEMGAHHAEMQAAVAAKLGISVEDLQAALAEGKTPADLAAEQGLNLDELHAALHAERGETCPTGAGAE